MTAGEREDVTVPPGLRERVLSASRRARAAGSPEPQVHEISPVEAFSRAADGFHGLLCALDDEHWQLPVLRDLDVQGLVGHLIGVEEDVHRCLAGDLDVASTDHITSTQPTAVRQAGRPPVQTRTEWRAATERTLLEVHAFTDLGAEVALWGIRLPLGALLVVRAFELWTHENDIRRIAGLPSSVPDAATLRLMTGLAVQLLPLGASLTGLSAPVKIHMVLTGPGGGTWDVVVGEGGGPPEPVSVVTGAAGFCWLAANRINPADLDVYVVGDEARATDVLTAVSALALD
jgi:uncharacterized protein (TIGR03083 family)